MKLKYDLEEVDWKCFYLPGLSFFLGDKTASSYISIYCGPIHFTIFYLPDYTRTILAEDGELIYSERKNGVTYEMIKDSETGNWCGWVEKDGKIEDFTAPSKEELLERLKK
jgi:hypothetical protein